MNGEQSEDSMVSGHWPEIARRWEQVGSPLRPVAEDIRFFTNVIERWQSGRDRPPRALILGVTPELFRLAWPSGTDVLAVDHTQAMIDAVWPGPRSAAVCAEWTQLPFQPGSRDIAICDGGVHLLAYPHEHLQWIRALHRVLEPGGCCALRLFVPPDHREAAESVLTDLLGGKIANLNILKLRLGMAMQETPEKGVQLARVWDTVNDIAGDIPTLATKLGWSLDHLLAIDTYRDCPKSYHFLSVAQVRRLFCDEPGGFAWEMMETPTYALGERCPTVVFRRI